MGEKKYNINPKNEDISIKVLMENIIKGYELQEIERVLTDDEILEYNGCIILTPDYQREYRFTLEDEVKLVESVLLGIPIPPIFLATDKFNGVRVKNVVDGQHRLRALYRFYKNKFALEGLNLLSELNGYEFEKLDIGTKADYLDVKLLTIIFNDFPGIDFEMEIFSRYNKGTKPLSQQEIRHAAYNSKINTYINSFVYKLSKEKYPLELYNAYNASKDRIQKKKIQEGIFVILNILENGIIEGYDKSLMYAEEYMKSKKELEQSNEVKAEKDFESTKELFRYFNDFIIEIQERVEFPFSKEIYGISSRNYKFQISIAMIIAGVFSRKKMENIWLNEELLNEEKMIRFLKILEEEFNNSFLEDPNYNASSTNSKKIKELIDAICFKIDSSEMLFH